jgi:hypothetical protein
MESDESSGVRTMDDCVLATLRAIRRNEGIQALVEIRTLLDLAALEPRAFVAGLNLMGIVILMRNEHQRDVAEQSDQGDPRVEKTHVGDFALPCFDEALEVALREHLPLGVLCNLWYNKGCCLARRKRTARDGAARKHFRLAFAAASILSLTDVRRLAALQLGAAFLFHGEPSVAETYVRDAMLLKG